MKLIKRIKFYQSIKCSTLSDEEKTEYSYIDTEKKPYKIWIDNNLIGIEHKETKEQTFSSLSNVVYFNLYEK